jgi:hypothetical protein
MGLASLIKRAANAIRDGWAIAGLTLLLIAVLELGYRGVGAVKRRVAAIAGSGTAQAPLDSLSRALFAQEDSTVGLQWSPYVYYRRQPVRTTSISVDSAGRRVTPQVAFETTVDSVYFFGGSTMWGSFQRDSFTLAALAAQALTDAGLRLHVRNYGESGYVLNQEVITLLRELQAGGRPRAVVFYDGINDLIALVQSAKPGVTQNESNRAREFVLGRRVFHWEGDLASDARAMAAATAALLRRSHLVQRQMRRDGGSAIGQIEDEELIASFLEYYSSTARIVEAIGREYGFCSVFVWQPTIHGTRKPLSLRESQLVAELEGTAFGARLIRLHRLAVLEVSRRHRESRIADNFIDLSGSLDTVQEELFVDVIGHTNEHANLHISRALADAVSSCLR